MLQMNLTSDWFIRTSAPVFWNTRRRSKVLASYSVLKAIYLASTEAGSGKCLLPSDL